MKYVPSIYRTVLLGMAFVGVVVRISPVSAHGGGGAHSGSAIPLEHGQTDVMFNYEYTKYETLSASERSNLAARSAEGEVDSLNEMHRFTLDISHGFSDDLTLGFSASFRDVGGWLTTEVGGEHSADPSGIEDFLLHGRYRFAFEGRGITSLLTGLRLPSGNTRNRLSNGELLTIAHQPSSGSLDAIVGLAHHRDLNERVHIDGGLRFTARGQGPRNQRAGNVEELWADLSYHVTRNEAAPLHVTATLGSSLVHESPSRTNDIRDINEGGTRVFVTPGLSLAGERWSASLSAPIPVSQRLFGVQQDMSYRIETVLTYSFGGAGTLGEREILLPGTEEE